MTRLRPTDLEGIASFLPRYDRQLIEKTGFDLLGIVCRAVGADRLEVEHRLASTSVGIVPISSGEGIIPGFAENLMALFSYLGCRSRITVESDVGGLREAYQNSFDIIMLADDHHFVAINTINRCTAENVVCTAKGYVTSLDLMVGSVRGKKVLIIGCGRVGTAAAFELIELGSTITVYDIDEVQARDLRSKLERERNVVIEAATDLDEQLHRHRVIFDASPAVGIIRADHVTQETFISAPGVPLGLSSDVQKKIGRRLIHDPLQIGASTMLVQALETEPEELPSGQINYG
jgi:pyrrolysine biosynthesis protein PylD